MAGLESGVSRAFQEIGCGLVGAEVRCADRDAGSVYAAPPLKLDRFNSDECALLESGAVECRAAGTLADSGVVDMVVDIQGGHTLVFEDGGAAWQGQPLPFSAPVHEVVSIAQGLCAIVEAGAVECLGPVPTNGQGQVPATRSTVADAGARVLGGSWSQHNLCWVIGDADVTCGYDYGGGTRFTLPDKVDARRLASRLCSALEWIRVVLGARRQRPAG
jgi:hypothetical protein